MSEESLVFDLALHSLVFVSEKQNGFSACKYPNFVKSIKTVLSGGTVNKMKDGVLLLFSVNGFDYNIGYFC